MSKSPINFGAIGAIGSMIGGGGMYGKMSDEKLRSQYDAYSRLGGGMMGGAGSFFGAQRNAMMAEIQRRQTLGDFGMPQQGSGGGAGSSATDPNNSSGNNTYAINPSANQTFMGDEALGNVAGTNPYEEEQAVNPMAGNFNPTTEQAAENIYGNGTTKFQPRKKLINL